MLFSKLVAGVKGFARDEEGAQVVEYALVIAVVSIALIGLMSNTSGLGLDTWQARVSALLNGN